MSWWLPHRAAGRKPRSLITHPHAQLALQHGGRLPPEPEGKEEASIFCDLVLEVPRHAFRQMLCAGIRAETIYTGGEANQTPPLGDKLENHDPSPRGHQGTAGMSHPIPQLLLGQGPRYLSECHPSPGLFGVKNKEVWGLEARI